jgi:hypothetical protein
MRIPRSEASSPAPAPPSPSCCLLRVHTTATTLHKRCAVEHSRVAGSLCVRGPHCVLPSPPLTTSPALSRLVAVFACNHHFGADRPANGMPHWQSRGCAAPACTYMAAGLLHMALAWMYGRCMADCCSTCNCMVPSHTPTPRTNLHNPTPLLNTHQRRRPRPAFTASSLAVHGALLLLAPRTT